PENRRYSVSTVTKPDSFLISTFFTCGYRDASFHGAHFSAIWYPASLSVGARQYSGFNVWMPSYTSSFFPILQATSFPVTLSNVRRKPVPTIEREKSPSTTSGSGPQPNSGSVFSTVSTDCPKQNSSPASA